MSHIKKYINYKYIKTKISNLKMKSKNLLEKLKEREGGALLLAKIYQEDKSSRLGYL